MLFFQNKAIALQSITILFLNLTLFSAYSVRANEYLSFSQPQDFWTMQRLNNYIDEYLFKLKDEDEINILKNYTNQPASSLIKRMNSSRIPATSFFNHRQALKIIRETIENNREDILLWLNSPKQLIPREFKFEFIEPIGYGICDINSKEPEYVFISRLVISKTIEALPIIVSTFPLCQ